MRPKNQMTATEKTVCYSQFPRGGGMPCHTGATREALGWLEGRGSEGQIPVRKLYTVVSAGRYGQGQGKQVWD